MSVDAFDYLYKWAEGVTWYIQNVMNVLYATSSENTDITEEDIRNAIETIVNRSMFAYRALLYQLAPKQKQVLTAIAKEGKVNKIMSQTFLKKHSLTSSMVQGALKMLLDRDFVTYDEECYQLCDRFFELMILR